MRLKICHVLFTPQHFQGLHKRYEVTEIVFTVFPMLSYKFPRNVRRSVLHEAHNAVYQRLVLLRLWFWPM